MLCTVSILRKRGVNLDCVRSFSILSRQSSNLKSTPKRLRSIRRFHAEFVSVSIPPDVYACNLRISAFGRCGDIRRARALFDQMPQRDVVTYSTMINLYLKNGFLPQAEALFLKIPNRNVVVESAMIDGLSKAGRIDEAQKLFDEMPMRNVFTWTALVSGYFRVHRVEEARRLFHQMPEKNVVSWTTMIWGYAQNGLLLDARSIFDRMPDRNIVSWTAMLKAYVDEGRMEDAGDLFDKMPHRNLYAWNIMISGYLFNKQANKAINLFESMPRRNLVSWTIMVSGLVENDMIDRARDLFDKMPVKDIAAWNAMLAAYISKRKIGMACQLFDLMPERNVVSWNTMIDGYVKQDDSFSEALKIFLVMLRSSVNPNDKTLTILLSGSRSMIELLEIHALAVKFGFVFNTWLANALLAMYSKLGELTSACLVFNELKAKDAVSWSSMILAMANHGYRRSALRIFGMMLVNGAQPDAITFLGVLCACSHEDLIHKGKDIFDSMVRSYELEPKAEHYSCLADNLGRAGRFNEALDVLKQVPQKERDGAVLGAILASCKVHTEFEVASEFAEELIEMEPSSSGTFVVLANAYASRGKWDDVARVRKMMKERRVEKLPGFSQIDVKMRSHVFFVADRAHPQQEEIYEILEEVLLPQMKDIEYRNEV
ncbi:hypothetical protein HPP92_027043 [Vanilla planifolia]|uniref:Uncharacterized protein n=1 Tax=Vanilla planifolia TaxID=51239 RepID=A0A835PAR9_VANPL|nr:hypothetical protein HPP92_027043 [Vanilla planifolia]